MRSRFLIPLFGAFAALFIASAPARADDNGLLAVKICGPTTATGTQCAIPNNDGTVPISGSITASLAGFNPTAGATANVTDIVNVSQDVALPAGSDFIVTNKGSVDVNFRLQAGAGTAVSTDQTLKAGAAVGIHVTTQTHLSAIAPTGTGTGATAGQLNIQGGTGLAAGYGGGSSSGGGGVVTQPTAANLNATVVGTGTFATQAAQSGTWTVQPGNTANTTAWKVDGSAVTQPVSAASLPLPTGAATAANQTSVIGTLAAGTAATNSQLTGCVYNSTEPSPTTGQGLANQCDSKGRQRQVIMDAAGNTRGANVTAGNALTVDGSAVTQPTSHASGSVASGAYASGSIASGAYASGSIASGAFASGAISNGADVVEGNNTDAAACTSGTSLIACTRQIHADAIASIPAGPNIIGKVGIDQTTDGTTNAVHLVAGTAVAGKVGIDQTTPGTSNAVQNISGTTGGVTAFTLTAAASTNATNVKASAGTLYHIAVYNNSATLAWVSFYNTSGTPTCGTSIVYQTMIPANSTSGAGAVEDFATGMNFSSGIGICVTTGIAGTGSVAATSYVVGLGYK